MAKCTRLQKRSFFYALLIQMHQFYSFCESKIYKTRHLVCCQIIETSFYCCDYFEQYQNMVQQGFKLLTLKVGLA
jgi:hypothetical protein